VTITVDVRGLTRRFGDFTAVNDVTFAVSAGEIFGFLGPNGAGKTTTIKMLIGLMRPTSGRATIAGVDLTVDPATLKQRVGYMSQSFSLYGDLTVRENISLFGGLYGLDRSALDRRAAWVLSMAGLEGRDHQLTASLPLGWKQRLALGCAVLHEPPILFLDEPTSGVDPIARRQFWDLIDRLAHRGTTVFVSTHYMEEAEFCHRLALMNRGRVIALDSPRVLRDGMSEPIYEIVTPDPARAVTTLQSTRGVVEAAMFGRNVHAVVSDDTVAAEQLRRALVKAGRSVDAITRVTPSLEDVFVSHVRRVGGAADG
jgi:ABC-2 type transport system ATP-binding protein